MAKTQDDIATATDTRAATSFIGRLRYRKTGLGVVGIYVFLILLMLAARFVSPSFGSFSFVQTVLSLSAYTIVVAFGQYLCVLTGGLDLSLPNVMALSGVLITGLSAGSNSAALWAIPVVLVLGAAIGLINGVGIAYFGITPVVMTLASNVIVGGVVLVYTGGTPRGSAPPVLRDVIQGKVFGGIPTLLVLLVILVAIGIALVNSTSFGRRVYAVGSNSTAATLSGVRVSRILLAVYAVSGLCAAIAGLMLTGYGNQSYLGMGDPYLLLSIAAVVIGGVNIMGGRGLYIGAVGGAVILTALSTILSGTSLPEAVRQIVFAVAIIFAVLVARQTK